MTTRIVNMDSRFRGNDERPAGMTATWIPACAGMTGHMDSRLRGNDEAQAGMTKGVGNDGVM